MAQLQIVWLLRPGMQEHLRRLYQEAQGSRRDHYEESRRRAGIEQEQIWLMQMLPGELVVMTLHTQKPFQTLLHLTTSELPFDRWFQERMHTLVGWNLQNIQPDPLCDQIFVWPNIPEYQNSSQKHKTTYGCVRDPLFMC